MTSSERRVQRVRKAIDAAGRGARRRLDRREIAKRLGHDSGTPTAEDVWNELRVVSPVMQAA